MWLSEWVNIKLIKKLSHHSSGVIMALVFWRIVGLAVTFAFSEGDWIRGIIEAIEGVVTIGLILWLAVQLFRQLWKGGTNGEIKSFLAA